MSVIGYETREVQRLTGAIALSGLQPVGESLLPHAPLGMRYAFVAIRGFAPITPVPPKARNRAFFCVDIAVGDFFSLRKEAKERVFHSIGCAIGAADATKFVEIGLSYLYARYSRTARGLLPARSLLVDCCLFVDILRL